MQSVFGTPIKYIIDGVALVVAVTSGVIVGIWKAKEVRAKKKYGLASNPTRCVVNEGRIVRLEEQCDIVRSDIAAVKATVSGIDKNVERLISMHLKD